MVYFLYLYRSIEVFFCFVELILVMKLEGLFFSCGFRFINKVIFFVIWVKIGFVYLIWLLRGLKGD